MKIILFNILCILSFNSLAKLQVNGAGASFPYPIYSKWFSEYKSVKKDVVFNYQAIGSGGGVRQLIKQTVDFGASDVPMKEKDKKKASWPVMHVPTVMGAVSVVCNTPQKANIKLDGKALANIFLGKITKWNHPEIASLNKDIKLPELDILVVRRADSSGTTALFSDYLSQVSSEWSSSVGKGKTLRWPTGIGAKGNDGVTNMVKQTEGAIGYVELAYAIKNNLHTISLKNKAGEYVKPSVSGVSKSAAALTDYNKVDTSIVNARGKGVYPISAFTYILVPMTNYKEAEKQKKMNEIKMFLKWALTDGQKFTNELHYAPLPKKLAQGLIKKLEK